MFSRTRAQRQKANTARQMARLFPVDPILVLERLDAAATAQLAACCAGARDIIKDGTRLRRLAARRWSWPQPPKSGNDDLVTLDDLRSMDDLERALSQWKLLRARLPRCLKVMPSPLLPGGTAVVPKTNRLPGQVHRVLQQEHQTRMKRMYGTQRERTLGCPKDRHIEISWENSESLTQKEKQRGFVSP